MLAVKNLKISKYIEERLENICDCKKDLLLYRIINHGTAGIGDYRTAYIDVSLIVHGKGIMGFQISLDSISDNIYGLSDLNKTFAMIEELEPFEFTGKAKEVHEYLKSIFGGAYFGVPGIKKETIKELVLKRDKLQKEEDERKENNAMTESNIKTVTYHGIELKIKEEKMEEYNTLTEEIDTMFKMEYAKSEEAKSEIVRYFTRYFRLNPFRRSDLSQDEKDNYHLDSLHELARMLEVHDIKFYTNGISESLYKFGMYHAKSYNNGVIRKAISTISHETPEGMFFRFDYDKLGETVLYGYEEDRKLRDMYDYIRRVEDDYDTIIVVLNRMRGLFDYAFKADAKSRSKKSVVNNAYGVDPIKTLGTKLI